MTSEHPFHPQWTQITRSIAFSSLSVSLSALENYTHRNQPELHLFVYHEFFIHKSGQRSSFFETIFHKFHLHWPQCGPRQLFVQTKQKQSTQQSLGKKTSTLNLKLLMKVISNASWTVPTKVGSFVLSSFLHPKKEFKEKTLPDEKRCCSLPPHENLKDFVWVDR